VGGEQELPVLLFTAHATLLSIPRKRRS
jgi:hypothetical protein